MKKFIALSIATTMLISTSVFAEEITLTNIEVTPIEATEAEDVLVTTTSVTIETTSGTSIEVITPEVPVEVIAEPTMIDVATGELMLPARTTAEELGYEVEWNAVEKSITFTKGEDVFKTTVGSDEFLYNGKVILTAPATKIVDSKSYIPGSFVNAMTPATDLPQVQDPTGHDAE